MKKTVYLAGPVLDVETWEAKNWRLWMADRLADHGIIGVSPLRCDPAVEGTYAIDYADSRFGTARAIAAKNWFDVNHCDLVLAYLPLPPPERTQSYGTIGEIGWARGLGKPVVIVTNDPRIARHPVVTAGVGWVLETLEEALDVCIGVLGGYTGGKNV